MLPAVRSIPTLLIVLAALAVVDARAQVVADTARGLVGQEVALAMRAGTALDASDSLVVSGSLLLGNATVFHPERFVAGPATSLASATLQRRTDSTYDFRVVLRASRALAAGDTLMLLAGEALTGFDSVCTVRFSPLRTNDGPAGEAIGVVITRSVGTPLPYVRYATLEPGYPNPARRYQTVSWGFRIDKQSPVVLGVYNLAGELVTERDLGELLPGIYVETIEIGYDVATGVYMVGLTTNSGWAWQFMHVVK